MRKILLTCIFAFSVFMFAGCDTQTYKVELNSSNDSCGSVYGTGEYTNGEKVIIAAESTCDGYAFDSWSDGDTNAIREIEIDENYNLTANFKEEEYRLVSVELFLAFGNYTNVEYVGLDYLNFEIDGSEINVFNGVNGEDITMDMYISKGLYSGSEYYTTYKRLKMFVEENSTRFEKTSSLEVEVSTRVASWQDPDNMLSLVKSPITKTIEVDMNSSRSYELFKDTERGYTVNIQFNFSNEL